MNSSSETPRDGLGLDVTARVRIRKYRSGERPETHEPFEVVEIEERMSGPTTEPEQILNGNGSA